jgi:hypothetical protein
MRSVGLALLLGGSLAVASASAGENDAFHQANELARQGDYPKAIAGWQALAQEGHATASLYWNWARAAEARGSLGEALWAQLQARELDPGDVAVEREVDRLRSTLNLDPAEIAPEPLAALRRFNRRFHLAWMALLLLLVSLGMHVTWRLARFPPGAVGAVWATLALGGVVALVVVLGGMARPVGVVVRRGAPLIDGASPTAQTVGSLREGEVVPILERSGDYMRVQDSSGARGWAYQADVRGIQ